MMRTLIAAALALAAGGQVLAADLPPAAAPPPRAPAAYAPPPLFSWTGFYLGINGGYAFGQTSWTLPTPCGFASCTTGNFDANGFLIGGTLGGNYQIGSFVIGLEGDGDWTNINGTSTNAATGCAGGCQTANDWLATVRGRAGFAWDRVLFYGTGGIAFGNIQAGVNGAAVTTLSTQTGWAAGAGIEGAIAPNWTLRAEYLYVNLGTATCTFAVCGGPASIPLTENIVRAGVDFKFGGW
jgi:outer membrane immunogenic protein